MLGASVRPEASGKTHLPATSKVAEAAVDSKENFSKESVGRYLDKCVLA